MSLSSTFVEKKTKHWLTCRITASIQSSLYFRCSHRALGSQAKRQNEKKLIKNLSFRKFGFNWNPIFSWLPFRHGFPSAVAVEQLRREGWAGERRRRKKKTASTSKCVSEGVCESAYSDAQVRVSSHQVAYLPPERGAHERNNERGTFPAYLPRALLSSAVATLSLHISRTQTTK